MVRVPDPRLHVTQMEVYRLQTVEATAAVREDARLALVLTGQRGPLRAHWLRPRRLYRLTATIKPAVPIKQEQAMLNAWRDTHGNWTGQRRALRPQDFDGSTRPSQHDGVTLHMPHVYDEGQERELAAMQNLVWNDVNRSTREGDVVILTLSGGARYARAYVHASPGSVPLGFMESCVTWPEGIACEAWPSPDIVEDEPYGLTRREKEWVAQTRPILRPDHTLWSDAKQAVLQAGRTADPHEAVKHMSAQAMPWFAKEDGPWTYGLRRGHETTTLEVKSNSRLADFARFIHSSFWGGAPPPDPKAHVESLG